MSFTPSAVPIAFDDQGRGEPALLCLPGWCADRSVFAELAPLCGRARRTLTLDWRGHGGSAPAAAEFGAAELVEDALAVLDASGVERVVPVTNAHAGWVALELRRRLGARVAAIVLIDWLVLDPPPPFLDALAGLQDPARWQATREQLFAMWLHGVDDPGVTRLVREVMGAYDAAMWARAARSIAATYRREGSPLAALAALTPPPPVLHLYAQPDDPGFLQAQQAFAAAQPWFTVRKLAARSHFPMLERAQEVAGLIEDFVARC